MIRGWGVAGGGGGLASINDREECLELLQEGLEN